MDPGPTALIADAAPMDHDGGVGLKEGSMTHPVIHWEIGGRNGEKLTSFYAELFGWEAIPAGKGYWLVEPHDGGVGGGIMEVEGEVPPHVTLYVEAGRIDATLTRAAELGGRILRAPTPIPGVGSIALFEDPEGNVIGLLSPLT
jgi:uncharacterized protein